MIRGVMQVRDRKISQLETPQALEIPPRGYVWVDVQGQTHEELHLLGERFGLHPLTLEDCEHLDQRGKLEDFGDYFFMVVHGFTAGEQAWELTLHELHIFFSARFVITVHMEPHPALDGLWRGFAQEPLGAERGTDFLLYRLCDLLADANFPVLERLSEAVEVLEDQILDAKAQDPMVSFMELKRGLSLMRRVLSPQRDVFGQLIRRDSPLVTEATTAYFRDIYDHLVRVVELVEVERELLANARDAWFTLLSQRTNEIMKRLTMASIIFLPLTFITGFFGMNFAHLPFDNDALMLTMIASMILVPVSMLIWFNRVKWL